MNTDPTPGQPTAGLDPRDQAVLDFERDWGTWQGDKGARIKARFGISSARYYQILVRLVDDPAAHAYDPLLVARLRRRRDGRTQRRARAQLGIRS